MCIFNVTGIHNDNLKYLCFIYPCSSFMYSLQIEDYPITLSCRTVNPKSIHETFKESLMRIFMKHVQPDPVNACWKLVTSEGESIGKLVLKCKILLSYVIGTHALRISDPCDVLVCLMRQCKYYLPDTYQLRLMWGV